MSKRLSAVHKWTRVLAQSFLLRLRDGDGIVGE